MMRRLNQLGLLGLLLVAGACTSPLSAPAVPDGVAGVSGPLALSQDGNTLWVVNPDADSVTRVDTRTLTASPPIPVGQEPWAVAVTPSGRAVVMNRLGGSVSVLDGMGRTDIPVGPEPGGLALSPSGKLAYVTASSADELAVVDLETLAVTDRIGVGRFPWSVAVTDDGDLDDSDETVVVAHRFARLRVVGQEVSDDGKEAWLTLLTEGREEMVIAPYEFGFANVLGGLALQGDTLWVAHLLNSPELPRDFETTVSGGLSTLSISEASELTSRRIHINEDTFSTPVNFPNAVAVTPDGLRAFVALGGTDSVMGISLSQPETPKLLGFWPAGTNPRGIVISRDGRHAYVMNILSRDLSVLDIEDTLARTELARIPLVSETLDSEILRGKILFNNANDPRISHLGWVSCASCHPGGGSDTTTWLTPEGARQTMPLWELEGTEPLHISASRDEVQDFESDIEGLMDGFGLAPGIVKPLLGEPNGGLSADLDALAAYVLRGVRVPHAATGDESAVSRGREVFSQTGCTGCHGGPKWTVSHLPGPVGTLAPGGELEVESVLVDVGTFNPTSDILGAKGFDIPTLLGLHATAPYLHDGSARTLGAVLENSAHVGSTLEPADRDDLVAFLKSLDGTTAPMGP